MVKTHQQDEDSPFHISVGAVPVGPEGKILVHRRTKENTPEELVGILNDLPEQYVLMHESLENDESLESAVRRGLKEEFGAIGSVSNYIGSLQYMHTWSGRTFEKTILYYEAKITEMGERSADDLEGFSELFWAEPHFLIEKMNLQAEHSKNPRVSEAKIIEAYLKYGKNP